MAPPIYPIFTSPRCVVLDNRETGAVASVELQTDGQCLVAMPEAPEYHASGASQFTRRTYYPSVGEAMEAAFNWVHDPANARPKSPELIQELVSRGYIEEKLVALPYGVTAEFL